MTCIEPWPKKNVDVMASVATSIFHKPNSGSLNNITTAKSSTSVLNARIPMNINEQPTDEPSKLPTVQPSQHDNNSNKQGEKSTLPTSSTPTPAQLYKKIPPKRPIKRDEPPPAKSELYNEVPQRTEQNYFL